MRRLQLFAAILAAAAAPGAALAQITGHFSYQGVLTDLVGTPVPDGSYDLTFRLYDLASGGTALVTDAQTAIPVVAGAFSVAINAATLPFDRTTYLGISVNGEPELTPRIRLYASPYALGLRLPFARTLAATQPLLDLNNTGIGIDARFAERVDIGATVNVGGSAGEGDLSILRSGVGLTMARLRSSTLGGVLELTTAAGGRYADFIASGATGGSLQLYGDSPYGIFANTSGVFSSRPVFSVQGIDRSAFFRMNFPGNESVVLPTDAIDASEILDEPGLASANGTTPIPLSGTGDVLLSRTVTPPSTGYCLVFGTVQVDIVHTAGATSWGQFGVSTISTFVGAQNVAVEIPLSAPSGTYRVPVSVHGVFSANGLPQTFYLVGDENGGNMSADQMQLSVIYLKTPYGTVTPSSVESTSLDAASRGPMLSADLERERFESERDYKAHVDRELADMRLRMAAMSEELRRLAPAAPATKDKP